MDLRSFSRREWLSFVPAALVGRELLAQDEPTFSTDVKVVNVLANVRTKKGEIVSNLEKPDFSVLEDGRPQTIRYFSRQTDLPLMLGLMVDTSMSQNRVLDAERSACFKFLDQVLRPNKDKVFIMQFDMEVMMRQELTSSWRDLNKTLEDVNTPTRNELSHQEGGGTLLYDAIIAASKVMRPQAGRKAVIVMTDGVDTGSEATLSAALEAAQQSDTLVYSVLFSDEGYYGLSFGHSDGRGVLSRLSRETGGGYFEVSKKQSIEQIFGVIEQELRNQYSLGFVSDTPVRISEFRRIELRTDQKGLVVQARQRYWAQP